MPKAELTLNELIAEAEKRGLPDQNVIEQNDKEVARSLKQLRKNSAVPREWLDIPADI